MCALRKWNAMWPEARSSWYNSISDIAHYHTLSRENISCMSFTLRMYIVNERYYKCELNPKTNMYSNIPIRKHHHTAYIHDQQIFFSSQSYYFKKVRVKMVIMCQNIIKHCNITNYEFLKNDVRWPLKSYVNQYNLNFWSIISSIHNVCSFHVYVCFRIVLRTCLCGRNIFMCGKTMLME